MIGKEKLGCVGNQISDATTSSGFYTSGDYSVLTSVSLFKQAATSGKYFKYATWNDILDPDKKDELGINYYANRDILNQLFVEGQQLKQIPARKRPPSSSDKLEVYDTIRGSSKKFVISNLSDKTKALYGNPNLTKEQASFVYELVVWLGILYQLEIGAFVASCCESIEYDTLFYQDLVGPALRSVVSRYNSNRGECQNEFSLRHRPKRNLTDASHTEMVSIFDLIIRLTKLSEILYKSSDEEVIIDSQFSSDFEGKDVVAPISVKYRGSQSKFYNSDAGLKLFLESLDPRLNKLFLVRVDTAHVWTVLQSDLLEKAALCESYYELYDSYLSQLFSMDSEMSLANFEGGLPIINKESELWKQLLEEVLNEGVEWESKYFADIYELLSKNHFEGYDLRSMYDEELKASPKWGYVTYTSKHTQEVKEIEKLGKTSRDLEGLIEDLLGQAYKMNLGRSSPSEASLDDFIVNKSCLENLCFMLGILEKDEFISFFLRKSLVKKLSSYDKVFLITKEIIVDLRSFMRKKIELIIDQNKEDGEIKYLLSFAKQVVIQSKTGNVEDYISEYDIKKVANCISIVYFLLHSKLEGDGEEKELYVADMLRHVRHSVLMLDESGDSSACCIAKGSVEMAP